MFTLLLLFAVLLLACILFVQATPPLRKRKRLARVPLFPSLALPLFKLGVWLRLLGSPNTEALANAYGDLATHDDAVSRLSDAAVARNLLVKKGTTANHYAVVAVQTDFPFGSTDEDESSAAEQLRSIALLGRRRTMLLTASEAIAEGVAVFAAAGGKVQDLPVGPGTAWQIGMSLGAAAADGDQIEVKTCVPIKVTTV